jgi:hypothetical protein
LWAWTQPALRGDRVWCYLTAVVVGLLVYHFTFQNDLPRYHDWDLFAIVAPGVTLWGLYAALHTPWVGGMRPALLFAALFTMAWIGVNHVMVLIHPNPDLRATYQRYRLLDLTEQVGTAVITPATPICAEATNCERVKVTSFTMPQNGDSRPTIFAHAPVRIELPLQVPDEATFLWLSPALDPVAWDWGGDGVTFTVAVAVQGQESVLWSRHLSPAQPTDRNWQTAFVALDQFRGQMVTLILATSPGPANNSDGDRAGWGLPWLMRGTVDERFAD